MGVKVGRYPNAGGTSDVRRMDFAAGHSRAGRDGMLATLAASRCQSSRR